MSITIERMTPEQALQVIESRKHDKEVLSLNDEAYRLMVAGDYETGRIMLKKAIELNPRYPTARLNLGASYYMQGLWTEAISWLESAIEMVPDAKGAEALKECR